MIRKQAIKAKLKAIDISMPKDARTPTTSNIDLLVITLFIYSLL